MADWNGGGRVWVTRVRGGEEVQVYPDPLLEDDGWTSDSGDRFVDGVAHAIPCVTGDVLRVYVDHGDDSPHNLAEADVAAYLVDEYGSVRASGVEIESAAYYSNVGLFTHPLPMPTVQAGDLLLAAVHMTGVAQVTMTGWEQMEAYSGLSWWYREADGSEGSTFNMPSDSNNDKAAAIIWRARGSGSWQLPPDSAAVQNPTGSGLSFPFPSVSVSYGSGRYAVFPVCSFYNYSDPSGPPGYTAVDITDGAGNHGNPGVYLTSGEVLASGSVSPGDVTFANSAHASLFRHMATIAVKLP